MKRVKQAGSDHITTIAALAEKAKESPLGNHFKTNVLLKDLPKCWGIKIDQIYLPRQEDILPLPDYKEEDNQGVSAVL